MVHIKYLADRKTGLWFHGWTFDGRHNFANALWARGNSWVTIVIPEFIELLNLPEGDAFRQFLISTLEAQVKALAACQSPRACGPRCWTTPRPTMKPRLRPGSPTAS
jgi:unsaturated rhamnogalacturonyl hydrolase